MATHTLYASVDRAGADRSRYFHVPDDARLPSGDFEVRSLTGRRLAVEQMAIEVYEIPEAEARKHIEEMLKSVAQKAKNLFSTPAPPVDPGADAARERRIAEALKIEPHQLHDDPKAVVAAVGAAFQSLARAVKEAAQQPDVGKERLKDVAEALRQEGADPATVAAIESIPDRLRELLTSEETLAKVDEAARKLREATEGLREEMERERMVRMASKQTPGEA